MNELCRNAPHSPSTVKGFSLHLLCFSRFPSIHTFCHAHLSPVTIPTSLYHLLTHFELSALPTGHTLTTSTTYNFNTLSSSMFLHNSSPKDTDPLLPSDLPPVYSTDHAPFLRTALADYTASQDPSLWVTRQSAQRQSHDDPDSDVPNLGSMA